MPVAQHAAPAATEPVPAGEGGLLRLPFHHAGQPTDPAASALLDLLLAQDGSTTRLCETVAGGAIQVLLHQQACVPELPLPLRHALPGPGPWLERLTTLHAHGQAMMDNLSYIAPERLPAGIVRELEAGVTPIGHLLARMWVRRVPLLEPPGAGRESAADTMLRRLWGVVGQPDRAASRAYAITTPDGVAMLIAETYRRGMRMLPG